MEMYFGAVVTDLKSILEVKSVITANLRENLKRASKEYLLSVLFSLDSPNNDWQRRVCCDIYGVSMLHMFHAVRDNGLSVLIIKEENWKV